jgi:hypothetical protein
MSLGSRRAISELSVDIFGRLLADAAVETIVLNGQSVVGMFEVMGAITLARTERTDWDLRRQTANRVPGIAYSGTVETFFGYELMRPVNVLGYNHNLQSSFGVTNAVKHSIGEWIAEESTREQI